MTVLTLTDPVNGTIVDADLHADNNTALRAVINGGISDTNVTASGLTDARLTSPNNAVYRTIHFAHGFIPGGATDDEYIFDTQGNRRSASIDVGGQLFYFNSADFTVAGKTTMLRVTAAIVTNATAIGGGVSLTAGLYPITATGGGAGALAIGVGTVVTDSTALLPGGAATTIYTVNSADFAAPATGLYGLGVVIAGGPTAANNMTGVFLRCLLHHV